MRTGAVLAAVLALGGCGVDFVTVSDRTEVWIQLITVHETDDVRGTLRGTAEGPVPPRLVVNGREVTAEDALFDRFDYNADLTVDSLRPGVRAEVSVVGGDSIVLLIPAMARGREPAWADTGGLSVPVLFGLGYDAVENVSWSATIRDSGRQVIGSVGNTPLSDATRILVPDSLLPDRAAFLTLAASGLLARRFQPFAITGSFLSFVEVAVPDRDPQG